MVVPLDPLVCPEDPFDPVPAGNPDPLGRAEGIGLGPASSSGSVGAAPLEPLPVELSNALGLPAAGFVLAPPALAGPIVRSAPGNFTIPVRNITSWVMIRASVEIII